MRHLSALFFCLLSLPLPAAITGTVMTSDGAALAGARVSIHALETPDARRARLLSKAPDAVPLATAQTDAKGSFSLASPKEPVVELRVELRGYEPFSRRVERDEDFGATALVKRDMQKGTVTAGGKPVANALVVISYGAAVDYVTRTDEQGRYEAPDIKRAYGIAVIHPDYAIDQGPASGLNRTLGAGVTLTGRAVAADGTSPVANAAISVNGWPLAVSGEDGAFTIAHAPVEWAALTARKDLLASRRAAGGDKTLTLRLEKSAVVSGRIRDAKTNAPLAGTMVHLYVPRMPSPGDPAPQAITDAKGTYSVPVPPGTYMLGSAHPGYAMQSTEVTVTAGQQVTKDLALTQLARVSGVVIDESNRPVAAATVTTEAASDTLDMRFMRDTPVISGPEGKFSIRIQAENDLRLRASKKGVPNGNSEAMKLAAGERKSAVVLTIPTGVAVTGRVLDASGEPLSGVSVTAAETPPPGMMRGMPTIMPGEEEEGGVRSASDGTFALRVKEGTYDFTFKREGYARKQVRAKSVTATGENAIEARLDPAVEISGRVTRGGVGIADVNVSSYGATDAHATTTSDGSFTLGGLSPGVTRLTLIKTAELVSEERSITAPARDVAIDLPQGGTIRGRVVEKGTKTAIRSFQAGVAALRGGGFAPMPQLKSFTSDDGSFILEHVPVGAMSLIADAPGYAGTRMNVDVVDGKALTDLVLELEPGVRLTGKITGANGAPLGDVSIMVRPSPNSTSMMRRTTTDGNGEYTIDGLAQGEEALQISHARHVETIRKVTLKGRETKLDVQLSAGERVTGVVVTEAGVPVADAAVSASKGMMPRQVRTNAAGAFEMETLETGRYRFRAVKSGYAEGILNDVDVSAGAPLRITLTAGGTISGRVTGLSEADLANTTVTATGLGRGSANAPVDAQGNFRLEGSPTGTVRVHAQVSRSMGDGRTSPIQTIEVPAGGSQQVTIAFPAGNPVRGRVTRNGLPLPGASVLYLPRRGGQQSSVSVTTDEQGGYTTTLEQGDYNVSVRDSRRSGSYNTTYSVRGAGSHDIDWKAGPVRGRVLAASTNEPVSNANVQLRSTSPDMPNVLSATTDPNGTFTIEYVPAGAYTVTAGGDGFANEIRQMTIDDTGRSDLELRLTRVEGVTMRVVDGRDGRQLIAMVTVFDLQGNVVHDPSSPMRFSRGPEDVKLPLQPGVYSAAVWASSYAPRNVALTVPSSPTVTLTPGGTIRLQSKHAERRRYRILDANGTPYPRSAMPRSNYGTLLPGAWPLGNYAPGLYTFQLLSADEQVVVDSQQVIVREGETVDVAI